MKFCRLLLIFGLCLLLVPQETVAQRGRRYRPSSSINDVRWENDPEFPHDCFTFVRLKYSGGRGWRGGWETDWPDSDLNFSFRLQQLTSLKVAYHEQGKILEIDDEELFDYPFIYMIEPGRGDLFFEEQEIEILRRYLLNGGFLMVDDFWGDWEWEVFYQQIKRVFPDREPVELPIEHPIFSCVYPLKEKPQVPAINTALYGRSWEGGIDGREVHYKAIFDDNNRIMVMVCHNTDLGDGWEREGENHDYFKMYSEPKAYPMGINIVFYAMTH